MSSLVQSVQKLAAGFDERTLKSIEIEPLVIEAGAIRGVAPYLKEQGYARVVVAADGVTCEIAGRTIEEEAAALGISVAITIIKPDKQGDVIADEASIIQLLLDIQHHEAQVVVAAGSGTIHDISRYAAYTAGIPFVSVPTAPSVDGFNSKGAPIIIRGEKKTIAAIGPDAIFADLAILAAAPAAMVAAGFGDMLGKYTSLFDWRFGAAEGGESYAEPVAEITRLALAKCVDHADAIARRDQEGVRILIEALIESGLAMLLFGQSHSASGSEHHLSHYWEMEYIRLGRRQLLHGAKVGVACAEISKLYHRLAAEEAGLSFTADPAKVREAIAALPDERTIRCWLRAVGGPSTTEELGVDAELLARSLREAHRVRPNRYTLLRAYNTKQLGR
ncbi:sn-glycerol-1-phosphate dehydrogenase [Paenibacillus arenilitoris]|uniref:Sn-glycerol-1-phosphate dehydrogenase n=1 Tax=Paenibacillus arenilitoris TaxID=2772299 RepID=A0A927H3L9_9BACL|nr:sn-glycerol-1-phosphate dehydrogenase [Paenibacillus arenilitoris]MBD2867481.1 sn-glycerol-1-phosphate dehydrogenase [Paenibacillus arenilitoris]